MSATTLVKSGCAALCAAALAASVALAVPATTFEGEGSLALDPACATVAACAACGHVAAARAEADRAREDSLRAHRRARHRSAAAYVRR